MQSWILKSILTGCVILILYLQGPSVYHYVTSVETFKTKQDVTPKLLKVNIIHGSGKYNLQNKKGPSWSQNGQDQYIDNLFNKKRNGFFVEIGGYDGETFSNTLFLEKERGWDGLLVEANPYTYKQMVARDRNCYMFNSCISNTLSNMTFIIGGALTSAFDLTSQYHRKRIDADAILYGGKDPTWEHAKENVNVKCYSLMTIMDALNRSRIDYFSLDVEGAELIILNSIDWKTIDIDVFTIETTYNRNEIVPLMMSNGYKIITSIGGDEIFMKIR